jgi:hypothetical protein
VADDNLDMMNYRRSRRIPDAEWTKHKETIKHLYLVDDRPLEGRDGVIDIMAKNGFSARQVPYIATTLCNLYPGKDLEGIMLIPALANPSTRRSS